ncbi:hypothetical protein EDD11_000329, partial [Mortierella claussenii]
SLYYSTLYYIIIMASITSAINKTLNRYIHLVSDISKDPVLAGEPKTGWVHHSGLFCDSFILWCLYNRSRDIKSQQGMILATIKDTLSILGKDISSIKIV